MIVYILDAIGALTVLLVVLILVLMFFGWLAQPVSYLVGPDEIQRYLRSWGAAIADGGRIVVRQPDTDRSIMFIKRQYKRSGEQLVFRFRNADDGRKYFSQVESAFTTTGIAHQLERTSSGRPRALVIPFPFGGDPLALSGAAHVTRLALGAMGAPSGGPFELTCTGAHRPGYVQGSVQGSVEVIPWTRGYRAGFRLSDVLGRLFGRS
jgi:hypothetical protein